MEQRCSETSNGNQRQIHTGYLMKENTIATNIAFFFSQIIECQRRVNPGMDVNEAEAQVIRVAEE